MHGIRLNFVTKCLDKRNQNKLQSDLMRCIGVHCSLDIHWNLQPHGFTNYVVCWGGYVKHSRRWVIQEFIVSISSLAITVLTNSGCRTLGKGCREVTAESIRLLRQTKQRSTAFPHIYPFPFTLLIQLTFGKDSTCTPSLSCQWLKQVSLCICLATVHPQFMALCHRLQYQVLFVWSIGSFKISSKGSQ